MAEDSESDIQLRAKNSLLVLLVVIPAIIFVVMITPAIRMMVGREGLTKLLRDPLTWLFLATSGLVLIQTIGLATKKRSLSLDNGGITIIQGRTTRRYAWRELERARHVVYGSRGTRGIQLVRHGQVMLDNKSDIIPAIYEIMRPDLIDAVQARIARENARL